MFTVEELSLIKIYSGFRQDRDSVISALNDSLPLIEEEEIKEAVKTTIRKANAMTTEAFAALDLTDTFETSGL